MKVQGNPSGLHNTQDQGGKGAITTMVPTADIYRAPYSHTNYTLNTIFNRYYLASFPGDPMK